MLAIAFTVSPSWPPWACHQTISVCAFAEVANNAAATDAAITYLIDLHGLFGDWPKALAAYNCGEARVLRAQREAPDSYLDFWDLYQRLPRETRRYVPRFFATLAILDNPEAYGMSLPAPAAKPKPRSRKSK